MTDIDFGEIQDFLGETLGGGVDFAQLVQDASSGKGLLSGKSFIRWVEQIFLGELLQQKQLWIHILILALMAAVLMHFADVFQSKSVSQISFCMIYMVLFCLLFTSFQMSLSIVKDVMEKMRSFLLVLAPAYFLAMTFTSYVTSAGVFHEFILFLIVGIRWLLEHFLLPCVEIYVLLSMVNHLSKDIRLSRLTDLLEMMVGWCLKAAVAAVAGFHMIQGLITPAVDAFHKTTISKGMEMVPGLGDIGSSTTELVLGSAMLIKNGIGAAALLILLFLCVVPLVKLLVFMLVYYVLAAVLQPVSDERISGCLVGMATGMKMLFQTVFTVMVLFMLSIALTTAATGMAGG